MVFIMPGMENLAPDRTLSNKGSSTPPSFFPIRSSSLARASWIWLSTSFGTLLPFSKKRLQTSVEIVNPPGTGTPALHISARPAPLPPRMSRILPSPSAVPPPNEYTYFFVKSCVSYVCLGHYVRHSGARAFCNDFGKISDDRELGQQAVKQRQAVLSYHRVWIVNQNFIEEQIHFRAERGDVRQLLPVRSSLRSLFADSFERFEEVFLGPRSEQFGVHC